MTVQGPRLGDHFTSRRERGSDGLQTLSVTLDRGLVPRNSLERRTETNLSPKEHLRVRAGDIAYNMMRMWQGASGLAEIDALVSPAYVVLAPKKSVDPLFAAYLFKLPEMIHRFWAYSYGLTDDRLRLYFNDFKRIPWDIPPLPEQKKIAEILSAWDKAIETTEKLLANAEARKRALMQQLLTGKRRLKGFEGGKWRPFRLDELAQINPRTGRTSGNSVTFLPMEAVSNSGQILARQERNVADLGSGYTVFSEGDILVAKITPCFENGKGCHATDLLSGMGVGSTEFHVLRARKRSDQRLLFHIVNSYEFRKRGEANMTGSAGQRRVPADYIKQFTLSLSEDVSVREMIGVVLDDAAMIETNLTIDIDRLKAEKLALMQQLLTGKRRVKV